MLYLIGGASRAGKSIASRHLFLEKQIPYISLDFLVMGFTNGLPDIGIDADKTEAENTDKLWPFVKAMAVCLIENEEDYIIEGAFFMPSQINELKEEYPDKVIGCFIGYSEHTSPKKLVEIREFNTGANDWSVTETDQSILEHAKRMIRFSKFLKQECSKFNIAYFDNSSNFEEVIRDVVAYLKMFE